MRKYVLLYIYFYGEGLYVFVKKKYWKKSFKRIYVLLWEITSSTVGCCIS